MDNVRTVIFTTIILLFSLGFFLMLEPTSAGPVGDVWVVDVDGKGDFETLTEAMVSSQVKDGDTIRIWHGVYVGQTTVGKSVTIIGNGTSNTKLSSGQDTLRVTAEGVSISGLTINSTSDNGKALYAIVGNHLSAADLVLNSSMPFYVEGTTGASLTDSFLISSGAAAVISGSTQVTLHGNTMYGIVDFSDLSDSLEHWNTHSIDDSNSVNGAPLIYLRDQVGGAVVAGAGQVILANCTGVTVEGQTMADLKKAVTVGFGSGNVLSENQLSDCHEPIYIYRSNSNTVSWNNISDSWYGISVHEGEGNELDNNNVTRGDTGIFLYGGEANRVHNNSVSGNVWGISLYGSDENLLADNLAFDNGIGIFLGGIPVAGLLSNHNMVVNNTVTNNEFTGIRVYPSHNNTLLSNTVTGNDDTGISIDGSTGFSNRDLTLKGNTVSGNSEGITVTLAENMTLEGNNISDNLRYAIYMEQSPNNAIIGNHIANNSESINIAAIAMYFGSDDNLVIGNTISDNGLAIDTMGSHGSMIKDNDLMRNKLAIHIFEGSSAITVDGNRITGPTNLANSGILVASPGGNNILNNTVTSYHGGINIIGGETNVIHNNTATGNMDGISLTSNGNLLSHNNASNNQRHGIHLSGSSSNLIDNNTLDHNQNGMFLESGSSDNVISSNKVNGNTQKGILMASDSNHNTIINNTIDDNPRGISLTSVTGADIGNNTFMGGEWAIMTMTSSAISIHNNTFTLPVVGISLSSSSEVTIRWNDINSVEPGITLSSTHDCIISWNTIVAGGTSIGLHDADRNLIDNNTMTGSHGLSFGPGNENRIENNTIHDCTGHGVFLMMGDDNAIINNSFVGNLAADIMMFEATGTVISQNLMDNGLGIMEMIEPEFWDSHVIEGNTIDGRPLVYLIGESDATVPEDAAQVFLVDCNDILMKGLNLSGFAQGLSVYSSHNITLADSNVSHNLHDGIMLVFSDENHLINNTIEGNGINGIYLVSSSGNTICCNTVTGHQNPQAGFGIVLFDMGNDENTVIRNTIENNKFGIRVESGTGNLFHSNNLIDNQYQADDYDMNIWNADYPIGGNHWSDYQGEDLNGDGMGDTPQDVWFGNQDLYPLMQPWSLDQEDPEADAGLDQVVHVGDTVTFNGSASTDNVGVVNYTWTFNDGVGYQEVYGVAAQHNFPVTGIFIVTLNVSDAQGNWDQDEMTVTVRDRWAPVFGPPPVDGQEAYHYEHSIIANETVTWDIHHNLPSSLTLTISPTSFEVEGLPEVGDRGQYWINATATSESGTLSTTHNWTFDIAMAWVPVIGPPPVDAQVNVHYEHIITVNESISTSIVNHNFPASLELVTDFENAVFTIRGTPQVGDEGTYSINFTVTSEAGKLDAFEEWGLIIRPGWAPTIASGDPPLPAVGAFVAGQEFQFLIEVNETSTFSLDSDASFLSVSTEGWVNGTMQAGTYFVNVTATSADGKLSASHNFTLVVSNQVIVSGQILDSDGEPAVGVQVFIDDVLVGETDAGGNFTILVYPGEHTMTAVQAGKTFPAQTFVAESGSVIELEPFLQTPDESEDGIPCLGFVFITLIAGMMVFRRRPPSP